MNQFLQALAQGQSATLLLGNNALRYVGGNDSLVISFHPAKGGAAPAATGPVVWGESFLAKRGVSMLGIESRTDDWYRAPALHDLLQKLGTQGFFARHQKVMLYGGSMGGFAALAFAELVPGCIVLAHNPQSTMIPAETGWEHRFQVSRRLDWSGLFNDGALGARFASVVYVTYDPYCLEDRKHVDRLTACPLVRLPVPFVGHQMPVWLQQMGVLGQVFDAAMEGTLTVPWFRQLVRKRTELPNYLMNRAKHARDPVQQLRLAEMARLRGPQLPGPKDLLWKIGVDSSGGTVNQEPPQVFWCTENVKPEMVSAWFHENHAGSRLLCNPFTLPGRPHDLASYFTRPSHVDMVKDEVKRLTTGSPNLIHVVRPDAPGFDSYLLNHLQASGYIHRFIGNDGLFGSVKLPAALKDLAGLLTKASVKYLLVSPKDCSTGAAA